MPNIPAGRFNPNRSLLPAMDSLYKTFHIPGTQNTPNRLPENKIFFVAEWISSSVHRWPVA